ncbi:MAG TPA: hypothetical protein VJ672_07215 [Gemmatimonadaceae bacterium]|nr:hypothetical protein [Gemmatimonadaceae bacterium]
MRVERQQSGTRLAGCCIMSMRLSRTRSRLMTLLATLAALGQLAVTVVAPLGEARAGQSAPAHVEAQGVAQHYAHDEATCVACSATAQLSLPIVARDPFVEIARHVDPHTAPEPAAQRRAHGEHAPRAPPSLA